MKESLFSILARVGKSPWLFICLNFENFTCKCIIVLMIKNRRYFLLGIFVVIIPFLGVPTSWRIWFTCLSGLFLIWNSIKISWPKVPKKLNKKREKVTSVFVQNVPPKVSDIIVPLPESDRTEEVENSQMN